VTSILNKINKDVSSIDRHDLTLGLMKHAFDFYK
jgi:hypothetical protein